MLNIGISEFRANMHHILKKVQQGETVTLTQRGVEVARLVPPAFIQAAARAELELLRETAALGDVLSPLDENWESNA